MGRVVSLLSLLGERQGEFLTLSEIARALEFNKATAHGILTALTDAAYVVRHHENKRYGLGPGVIRVGRSALRRAYDVAAIARAEMETLADQSGAQCAIMVRHGDQISVVAATGSPAGTPGTHVGQRTPRLPPFGIVFVAWSDEQEIEIWLQGGSLSEVEQARYRAFIAEVRERGFSVSAHTEERHRLEDAVNGHLHDIANPEVRQALVGLMAELARDRAELCDIEPERHYRLRTITAPIFEADGRVLAGLALTGLPEMIGARVCSHGCSLTAAAARITKRIESPVGQLELNDTVLAAGRTE